MADWKAHMYRVGPAQGFFDDKPSQDKIDQFRKEIEPWLAAVFQSEHLSLLLGGGFTAGIAESDELKPVSMKPVKFNCALEDKVNAHAKKTAAACGRGEPNIEDQLRSALALLEGLKIRQDEHLLAWSESINRVLTDFLKQILGTESQIRAALDQEDSKGMKYLLGFLLSFASRTASRDRLNIFTTNYDRLIEHACDRLGIRVMDRFVGALAPEFRSSRQSVDFHYNPPGIRGEPRYLEGVVRLTKLHGSIDWEMDGHRLIRRALAFGAEAAHPEIPKSALNRTMIYPNPAKDVETLFFPYAELFRDFANALCQPNSSLVTYGYGFGDDHINRVISDMLTIPSTHLVIISWNHANGRVESFCKTVARESQISLLIGNHFADMGTIVQHYLPKPSIDLISVRKATLLERRGDSGKQVEGSNDAS